MPPSSSHLNLADSNNSYQTEPLNQQSWIIHLTPKVKKKKKKKSTALPFELLYFPFQQKQLLVRTAKIKADKYYSPNQMTKVK